LTALVEASFLLAQDVALHELAQDVAL